MGQLDFGVIGNCQISAILDKKAQVVWSCMPRFDSPSVFSALLDSEEAGMWSILPANRDYETRQRYLPNTNVIHTEFHLKNGDRYDIFDFAPRYQEWGGYYRPPQIIRIIRPVKGNPPVRFHLRPRFDYGKVVPDHAITSSGIVYRSDSERLYLNTDIPLTYVLDGQSFELTGPRYCVLSHGEPFRRPLKTTCEDLFDRTVDYWRTWVKHCNIPFEYQEAVIRSALALKLHVFEDTGAIIAATTTSIPESPDGGRTWDYRFCWLRDAYFVVNVLNQLGHFEEMERFIQYLHNIAVTEPGAELQPVYGIGGERRLEERTLSWLQGFQGIGPVRIGNAAHTHAQYDVYGEMVLAVIPLFFDQRLDRSDLSRAFENVVQLVERAIVCFDRPDSGIWEFRSEPRHYVFSKIMCWAAVDRGLKIAERMGKGNALSHWKRAAETMRAQIERDGWDESRGVYGQCYGSAHPDASNLLMAAVGFHGPDSPRFHRMIKAYEETLLSNGYVFRYRNEDDFGLPRHAFTICTFWFVDALAYLGRKEEARALFERVLSCSNHLGLLSEDVDPKSGELWGNFPQTYSHVGVINSAFRLSKSWGDAF